MSNNRNPTGKGGFSDNPQNINREGRPRIDWEIVEILKEELNKYPELKDGSKSDKTKLEHIINTLLDLSNSGNVRAMALLLAYMYGRPREHIEHSGSVGISFSEALELIKRNKNDSGAISEPTDSD